MTGRFWLSVGALCGMLTVALGAFGSHGLQDRVPETSLATWETATSYLGWHALALLACGLILLRHPGQRLIQLAAAGLLLGILLFSGSLYVLVLSGVAAWGMVTPFGGTALVIAWAVLAVGSWRLESSSDPAEGR